MNFDRLAETGFETAYTLREGVRDLVDQFTGDANPGASTATHNA